MHVCILTCAILIYCMCVCVCVCVCVGVKKSKSKFKYTFNRSFDIRDLQLILQAPAVLTPSLTHTNTTTTSHTHASNSGIVVSFILRGKDKAFEVVTKTEAECIAWVNDLIRLKTLANTHHSTGQKPPFYTRNQVFTVNMVANDKRAPPLRVRSLSSGELTSSDECGGTGTRVSSTGSSGSSGSGSLSTSRYSTGRGSIGNNGNSTSLTVQLKHYSVHRSVDLSSGVLFTTDLVDERALQVQEKKDKQALKELSKNSSKKPTASLDKWKNSSTTSAQLDSSKPSTTNVSAPVTSKGDILNVAPMLPSPLVPPLPLTPTHSHSLSLRPAVNISPICIGATETGRHPHSSTTHTHTHTQDSVWDKLDDVLVPTTTADPLDFLSS